MRQISAARLSSARAGLMRRASAALADLRASDFASFYYEFHDFVA
jgi:hypothetical protein